VEHFGGIVGLAGIVIVVAALFSGVVERTGIPLVAVFLALGALLGPWGIGAADFGLDSPMLRTLGTLALALVLFSDAVTIELSEIRSRRRLTWRLLGPGTLIPAIAIAGLGVLLLDLSLPAAAILGAALASTDPVLLRSVLRSKALPATPRVVLRMESGMNDVVLLPIVVFGILLLQRDGAALTMGEIGRHAVGLFLLGPALGALVGYVGITLLAGIRDRIGVRRDYESLYALGLAFTGYAGAEGVGGSGFLAAFAAGFVVATRDVELCDCFLEYGEATAEMLLLLTFVALGTSLIWSGLNVLDVRTLTFAVLALLARTVILYPMLAGIGVDSRDRRLIALFGPRGLSSLLFALLPVFAGVPGSERLFTIVCLVVLMSVVVHGGGIGLFLRRHARSLPPARGDVAPVRGTPGAELPERITIGELAQLRDRGEEIVIVDARAERSYGADTMQAAGAIRLAPDEPVADAQRQRLAQHATLVVYCA
jgi:NhaP-type Na+/H+ or K+/H+ antiporter